MVLNTQRGSRAAALCVASLATFFVHSQAFAGSTGEIIGTVSDRQTQKGVAVATFNYGATPYIPVAIDNSQEFLFMMTEKL
jgi:hypothetical protein